MKEVTELFEKYREATRSLWNQFIFPLDDLESGEADSNAVLYKKIEKTLLEIMVLNQIDPAGKYKEKESSYYPQLRGQLVFGPKGGFGLWAISNMNLWEWKEILLKPGTNLDLRYMRFFDWSMDHLRDNRFYQFRVLSCNSNPEIVGADFLVEPLGIKIFYDKKA